MARVSIVVCMSKGAGHGFNCGVYVQGCRAWCQCSSDIFLPLHPSDVNLSSICASHGLVFGFGFFFPSRTENLKIQNLTHSGFELATFRLPTP